MDINCGNLLVVDDNEMNRDMLSRRLTRFGYEVMVAEDGLKALALIDNNDFDVILLDIVMPGLNGIEVLERIRLKRSMMQLPVIMTTSKDEGTDIVGALEKGANDYITKPIDFGVAQARIRTQLQIRQLEKDLKVARDEALKASKVKSDFLAGMSHEIRTPMNTIVGMAELLGETTLDAEQKEYVETLKLGGDVLLTLINDILDLSKIEAGCMELESIDFDIRDMIEKTHQIMMIRAKGKGLYLNTRVADDVPNCIIGDPARLRQILINLIGNSVKFTEKGGIEVDIANEPNGDCKGMLRFTVSDSGIGIPADRLEAIFAKFSQADTSTTRKYGGTGLGLSISKHLSEMMSGKIWVESEVGKGSRFIFTAVFGIPETIDILQKKGTPVMREVCGDGSKASLRILLVDDAHPNRMLIKAYLKQTAHCIEEAENGEEACRKFKDGNFDLVLMDMQMPVMDGLTATREIRKWESENGRKASPIIALTAHAMSEHQQHSMDAGCNDHLTKPIKKDVLLQVLDKYSASLE